MHCARVSACTKRGEPGPTPHGALQRCVVRSHTQDGEKLIFDSSVAHRDGIAFVPGRTLHAEALERGVLGLQPGSAADVLCVDVDAGSDSELGIMQLPLSDALKERACARWEEARV